MEKADLANVRVTRNQGGIMICIQRGLKGEKTEEEASGERMRGRGT